MGFLCRHCGNTFERLELMEMHSERCWKANKAEQECNCTLCFCYRTKKHIDLCDMQSIIDDVKFGEPVSDCLDRLYRDDEKLKQKKMIEEGLELFEDYECKKPLHPGKVSNDLLRLDDDNTLIDGSLVFSNILIDLDLCGSRDGERFIKRFFDGLEDVDHILAYKLAKAIEGTDVRFWMDLQERYDEYMRKNK